MLRRVRRHWQLFKARREPNYIGERKYRDKQLDTQHMVSPENVVFSCNTEDPFDCAEQELLSMVGERPTLEQLEQKIDAIRERFERTNTYQVGLLAILAQAPRAVLAQIQMDEHPHGYRNKQERLYELIDFNDTIVATVLVLNDTLRTQFAESMKQSADRLCKRIGVPCFTNEQWTAIVRGLTREVAVYSAAKNNGFNAVLTSRTQDALGIDVQVQDPQSRRYINVDVKTPSAFHYRIRVLMHEGRLNSHEADAAEERGYALQENGHGKQKAQIVLLCIVPEQYGDLANFRFVDEAPMRESLNRLIREYGLSDGKFGMTNFS